MDIPTSPQPPNEETPQNENVQVSPAPAPNRFLLPVGIGLFVLLSGAITWVGVSKHAKDDSKAVEVTSTPTEVNSPSQTVSPSSTPTAPNATWSFNGSTWSAVGTAPSCSNPMSVAMPTSLDKVTNILYPGQVRGGNYKAHGGFRFDGAKTNAVDVSLTFDSYLYRGTRYIEGGEVQTLLDFINPCGYMVRYDHLLTLTPDFQKLVDTTLPEAKENASQTTAFPQGSTFIQGTKIATEVGFSKTKNVSFDFGVYDLRKPNAASQSSAFMTKVGEMKEMTYFGTCWLALLKSTDSAKVLALPGSGTEGKTSDYCE